MIVRDLETAANSVRRVDDTGWTSVRLLLKNDAMGFSFHITTIYAGAELLLHYSNHLESVYCISGSGSIEDLQSGTTHAIRPGVIYALDQHDRHVLRADTELQLACVFNPPLTGLEVHDENRSYPLEEDPVE